MHIEWCKYKTPTHSSANEENDNATLYDILFNVYTESLILCYDMINTASFIKHIRPIYAMMKSLNTGSQTMKFDIVEKEDLIICGMNYFGDPFQVGGAWSVDNAIGRLWKQFMDYIMTYPHKITGQVNPQSFYELHIQSPGYEETGEYAIMIGVQVQSLQDIPIELVAKHLPASQYLRLHLVGNEIVSDWNKAIEDYFTDSNDYQVASNFSFEHYDHRFKGMDRIDESELDIYVPIQQTP